MGQRLPEKSNPGFIKTAEGIVPNARGDPGRFKAMKRRGGRAGIPEALWPFISKGAAARRAISSSGGCAAEGFANKLKAAPKATMMAPSAGLKKGLARIFTGPPPLLRPFGIFEIPIGSRTSFCVCLLVSSVKFKVMRFLYFYSFLDSPSLFVDFPAGGRSKADKGTITLTIRITELSRIFFLLFVSLFFA